MPSLLENIPFSDASNDTRGFRFVSAFGPNDLALAQQDGDQHRRVFDSIYRVRFAGGEVEQLPGREFLSLAGRSESNAPFQALHGDLARRLVRRNLFAGGQNQTDHFQSGGFYQRRRFGVP